jgi:archaellum component FlaC
MNPELLTLLALAKEAEERASIACQNVSTKDLDDSQNELDAIVGALVDAQNTLGRAMDVKKAELNDMKNDVNELDARAKAAKRRGEQCKRACISLRIAARSIEPFPHK